ncbi:MAG TPA: DUF4232 domain-containing protein [Actinoplanes sp.]|nr:DUF4232 domain-containing protein [Actinoplanes sp.]
MRRIALLLLVPVLAACSWRPFQYRPEEPAEKKSPAPVVSAAPPCLHGARITVGETDGAMGLRAVGIELHNCGRQAFDVDGYPVVEVLDADRVRLDVRAIHGVEETGQGAVKPERVTVQPGESARASLVWRNVTTGEAVTGAFLSVAAAGGQPRHEVPIVVDVGSTGRVSVGPWTATG